MKGGQKVVIEPHRHEGVFIARAKEDALVTLNDEAVYMGTLLPPAAEDADTRCRPI